MFNKQSFLKFSGNQAKSLCVVQTEISQFPGIWTVSFVSNKHNTPNVQETINISFVFYKQNLLNYPEMIKFPSCVTNRIHRFPGMLKSPLCLINISFRTPSKGNHIPWFHKHSLHNSRIAVLESWWRLLYCFMSQTFYVKVLRLCSGNQAKKMPITSFHEQSLESIPNFLAGYIS